METKLKCIICGEDAKYVYLGNSYCEEHKNEHQAQMAAVIKDQK